MKALWKMAPVVVAAAGFLSVGGMTPLAAVAMPPVFQGPPPPPPEYREVERRGFHDGVEGARHDYGNHRRPDVNNRDEFRHPHVAGRDRRPYQDAFVRGYQLGVQRFYGHEGPPPRY